MTGARVATVATAVLAVVLVAGCTFEIAREQQERAAVCVISGTVRTARPTTNPLVVALVRHSGTGDLEQPANWEVEGTPVTFRYLIEHLDRTKFQPWVYYYPSGAGLGVVAGHLTQTMRNLQLRHGFQRFFVVAHSMGGLVSRGFILRYQDPSRPGEIPVYVTIATPWGGAESAALGAKYGPAVVGVFRDLAPDSAYLREIFYQDAGRKTRRTLPRSLTHHLLFTFNRDSALPGPSGDHAVTVASQMRPEAQQEAHRLYGFDLTHTGIFHSPEVSRLLNEILAEAAR